MDRDGTISLAVDPALVEEARSRGVDLDQAFERALRRELAERQSRVRADDWKRENAAAIESWNEDVRRNGLWCDDLRQF